MNDSNSTHFSLAQVRRRYINPAVILRPRPGRRQAEYTCFCAAADYPHRAGSVPGCYGLTGWCSHGERTPEHPDFDPETDRCPHCADEAWWDYADQVYTERRLARVADRGAAYRVGPRYKVNRYYSDELTTDPEGNLVLLCAHCAAKAKQSGVAVQWAACGDPESVCELCRCVQREKSR